MRKILIVFLSCSLILFCSCKRVKSDSQSVGYRNSTSYSVSVDNLKQFFLSNVDVFENAFKELSLIPTTVSFIVLENDALKFYDSIGKEVFVDIEYEYAALLNVFVVLKDFSDCNFKTEFTIMICRKDYGFSFLIRDLNEMMEYSIEYCDSSNYADGRFSHIKDYWYVYKIGLV